MSINKYSSAELGNIGLAQGGSVYESGVTAVSAPSNQNIVAITAIGEDAVFAKLNPTSLTGTVIGNTSTATDYNGDAFTTLTEGVTIYGTWSGFTLSSGNVIAYFG